MVHVSKAMFRALAWQYVTLTASQIGSIASPADIVLMLRNDQRESVMCTDSYENSRMSVFNQLDWRPTLKFGLRGSSHKVWFLNFAFSLAPHGYFHEQQSVVETARHLFNN